MRLAFLGTRGIPACYSGFETFVEQIATRLVRRGHRVTVYNRLPFNQYRQRDFQGVRIVCLPTIPTKATDTIVHTGLSVMHACLARQDIAYFCGVGNSLLSPVVKLGGTRTLVNVDGADYLRAKWSGFGRWWLRRSESWAARLADVVVADNRTIQRRYQAEHGITPTFIPYGANIVTEDPGTAWLQRFGLKAGGYLLYVSRLTPENAADVTMRAYLASRVSLPLVVVGDAPYQSRFIAELRRIAATSPRIILTGFLFGEGYQQLSYHARAFVLPSAIDATRPVLLDQMGFGNCIIARNTPGNLEVVGDTAFTFDTNDPESTLAQAIATVAADAGLADRKGREAQERARILYDWDVICTQHEEVFRQLLALKRS